MEVSMLRKIVIASTLGLFLATSVVTPASAATIKTGSACTKAGSTKKVGSKTYVCGKNPFVTPTKNTFMLKACYDGYDVYLQAKDGYDSYKDLAPLIGAEGQAQLDELKKSMDSIYSTLRTKACKRGA
jgi:hypothetical protein